MNDTVDNKRVFEAELLALSYYALGDKRFEGHLENLIVPGLADKMPDLGFSRLASNDHSIEPVSDLLHRLNVMLRLTQSRVCTTCALCLGSIGRLNLLLKLRLILHLLLLRLLHVLRESDDEIGREV